jgi:DNA-binding transcriptional MocR family regulator
MQKRSPQALLFIDETYREASYGDAPVAESLAALDPRVITGASVSKALGAPGLRTGWLTVVDAELRSRLVVAKMNTVISGSVLDETLATTLLQHREHVLAPRRNLLAGALDKLTTWCEGERERIEWVRPDAGALCCLRLRTDAFDAAAVTRFWDLLPQHDLQLACGTWFGESDRAFRLGFGYLPPERFGLALSALSASLDAAAA